MKATLLIAASSEDSAVLLEREMEQSPYFEVHVCRPAGDGPSVVAACRSRLPDLVLLDEQQRRMDGLSVLREILRAGTHPAVVYLASPTSAVYDSPEALRVSAVVTKPYDTEGLVEHTENVFLRRVHRLAAERGVGRVNCELVTLLQRAGIPAYLKGYRYLQEAIRLSCEDESIIHAMTGRLYPEVARLYRSTPCRVERAMRSAVAVAWSRGEGNFLRRMLGYGKDGCKKPSNSEFIAAAAEMLRLMTALEA